MTSLASRADSKAFLVLLQFPRVDYGRIFYEYFMLSLASREDSKSKCYIIITLLSISKETHSTYTR